MNILLDTHAIIWLGRDSARLSVAARAAYVEAEAVYVSVVSAWEYGVIRRRQPAHWPEPFDNVIATAQVTPLSLDFAAHRCGEALPDIHRDPFDRMLVAQAMLHDLTLVTADETIHRYPVKWLW